MKLLGMDIKQTMGVRMDGTMFRCRLRTSLLPTHSVREGSPSPGLSIDMSKVKIQYEVDGARPVHCWHSCITPNLLATVLSFAYVVHHGDKRDLR